MTALVTGASGGLGLALVAELTRLGRPVVAVGRRDGTDPRLAAPGVRYLRLDLSDRTVARLAVLQDVTTVFHCAALSAPWGRARDFERANVGVTRNLLNAAQDADVGAFIHVSTPSIFAAMRDRVGIGADDQPSDPPLGDYARTKLEAERMVLGQMAVPSVAIRPRAIVGPDDAVVLPRLAALLRRPRVPLIRDGAALVEFTDVRDVVSALLAAERTAERNAGRALNVSGGRPVTVLDAARRIAEAIGTDPRFVPLPMGAARALAGAYQALWPRGGWAGEPAITPYVLSTLAHSQTFDLADTRQALGWAPRHDGLATLVAQAEAMR